MMKRGLFGLLAFASTFLIFSRVYGESFQIPELTAPVMDEAGVIGQNKMNMLSQLLREANARNKVQLTILTLPTLADTPIEQATIQIVDKWKLGKKGIDNGVLFLIVPAERKARIEVGMGLEGDIPDVIAKRILADVARPYFKKGLYGDGVLAASLAILKRADPEFSVEAYSRTTAQVSDSQDFSAHSIVVFLILVLFVLRIFAGTFWGGFGGGGFGGWGGGFGGGSSGGGGWGGGGGGFSGGGSSDSW